MASIRDGTSNTLGVSECIVGQPQLAVNSTASVNTATAADNGCPTSGGSTTSGERCRGNSWFKGYRPPELCFTTLMTPNSSLYDCGDNTGNVMHAARSYHPGVVQAAMIDGSTHGVSETIDWATWRWLGNKADGNPVQLP